VRHGHRRQLEDIAAKLLYFESSLRNKEKCLQDTLATKDQVRTLLALDNAFWL
jgi:hypothetical protein